MPDKFVVVDVGGWISGPMDNAATVTPGITNLMHRVVTASTKADVSIVLRGIPANVGAARRFARASLAGCPRAEDLVLAVSEMASNAIAWSASGCGGTFTVRVRTASRWARVEVADQGPAPVPAASGNGFGLGIVASVADRTGHSISADGGRTAWAEVTWPVPDHGEGAGA